MLGSSKVAAQLAAFQEELSSMSDEWFIVCYSKEHKLNLFSSSSGTHSGGSFTFSSDLQ
jgi:hypothetical protein